MALLSSHLPARSEKFKPPCAKGPRHIAYPSRASYVYKSFIKITISGRALLSQGSTESNTTTGKNIMNSSIRSADRTIHLKIVVVSLVAAILVVVIGISARDFSVDEKTPIVVAKAGKSVSLSIKDVPTVR
jgi:hypothetical protein